MNDVAVAQGWRYFWTFVQPANMTDNAVLDAVPHSLWCCRNFGGGRWFQSPALPPSLSPPPLQDIYRPVIAPLQPRSVGPLLSRAARQLLAFMADNTNIGVIMSLSSLLPLLLLFLPLLK